MGKMKSEPKAPRALNFHRSCHNDYLQLQSGLVGWLDASVGYTKGLVKPVVRRIIKRLQKKKSQRNVFGVVVQENKHIMVYAIPVMIS
jgi:hypothetical protein